MLVKIVSIPIIRIAIQPLRLSGGYRLIARFGFGIILLRCGGRDHREDVQPEKAACLTGFPRQQDCRTAQRHAEFDDIRSEEHTSELQSLMRISYAVFCLKKKLNTKNN